jgi:hypothetical protein
MAKRLDLPMSDVDWPALWAEFALATDNKQIEVAERIVYLDGRWDFAELSIRERVERKIVTGGPEANRRQSSKRTTALTSS